MSDWKCQQCGATLTGRMDTTIRCDNGHVASGPWDEFLRELREAKSRMSEARDSMREALTIWSGDMIDNRTSINQAFDRAQVAAGKGDRIATYKVIPGCPYLSVKLVGETR